MTALEDHLKRVENAADRLERALRVGEANDEAKSGPGGANEPASVASKADGGATAAGPDHKTEIRRLNAKLVESEQARMALAREVDQLKTNLQRATVAAEGAARALDDAIDEVDAMLGE